MRRVRRQDGQMSGAPPEKEIKRNLKVLAECGGNYTEASHVLGTIGRNALREQFFKYPHLATKIKETAEPEMAERNVDRARLIMTLRRTPLTIGNLAKRFGVPENKIMAELDALKAEHFNVHQIGEKWSLVPQRAMREAQSEADWEITSDKNNVFTFGALGDTHLCSKYYRADVLNDLYDRFAARKISHVFHCGNYIDGEFRFNRHDLLAHGIDEQLAYFARHYPQRKGITTYYVDGDDHEGWYVSQFGIEVGKRAEQTAREMGREDLRYMGYMEADVRLVNANTGAFSHLRVMHPGGGSAYAISYKPQKIVEALGGGDKPAVLLLGHYHKQELVNYRNVFVFQCGCTQDQTPFLRKNSIEAHVGAWIVNLEQDPETGAIVSANDMMRYFDRGYYEDRNRRWNRAGGITQAERGMG